MQTLHILTTILFFALWACYAVIEGWREGEYLHARIKSDNEIGKAEGRRMHLLWWLQRSIVVMAILCARGCSFAWGGWATEFHELIILASLALIFPFLHDGKMYATRNNLDNRNYPLRWLAQSSTSTARSTSFFTPAVRTVCLFLGLTAFITDVVLAIC